MIYDHVVNHNGVYYMAGQDVPDNDEKGGEVSSLPFTDTEIELETSPQKYTREDLEAISVKKMRQIAEDMGVKLSKVAREDVINEFLEKQR